MRKLLALVVALMMVSAVALADVPAFEDIVFPDAMPSGIIFADDTYDYSYDDMSTQYDFSLITGHYGIPNIDNEWDPTVYWFEQHFNLNISYQAVDDTASFLSTRAAADDLPDLFPSPSRDFAFALDDAGKLIDAKTIYPYMPLSCQYATSSMIKWSTNQTGRIPFVTGYGIQDGIWTDAIRKDWLDKFGMDFPKNTDDLMAFAEAVKTQDPDGNGVDDTYLFAQWGTMKNWTDCAFGDPQVQVGEDGLLSHPYFNGIYYNKLNLWKTLVENGYVHPDGAIMDWNQQKIVYANNQVACLYYPVSTLLAEWVQATGSYDEDNCNVWEICAQYPFGDGEYSYAAAGNPGYQWCFPTYGYEDEGKVKRIAHFIDSQRAGGENFDVHMQGGVDRLYEFFADAHDGIEKNPNMTRSITYTDDGYFYLSATDLTPDNKDDNSMLLGNAEVEGYDQGAWQCFGLIVPWQLSDPNPADETRTYFAKKSNEHVATTASVSRYPNYGLLVTLTGEAVEAQNAMSDWISACETEFINGTRELTEESYAAWTQEWLDRGGYAIVEQQAECLGCDLPEELQ